MTDVAKTKSNLKTIGKIIFLILLPIVGTLMGGWIGLIIAENEINNPQEWTSLGKPPGDPDHLVGLCNDVICVLNANGKLYHFTDGCNPTGESNCWQETLPQMAENIKPFFPQNKSYCTFQIKIPTLPDDTIQIMGAKLCDDGGDIFEYYALGKNGIVWQYKRSISYMANLDIIGDGVIGIVLGFIFSGLLVVIVLVLIRLHKSSRFELHIEKVKQID